MNLLPDQTVIFQWILFALVYLVLTRLVFHPVLKTLKLRTARTEGLAAEAQGMAQRADEKLKEFEERMAIARTEALTRKDAMIRQGIRERETILKAAKEAWDETIKQTRTEIAGELKSASLAIKGEVHQLAMAVVEKVLL